MMMTMAMMTWTSITNTMMAMTMIFTLRQTQREKGRVSSTISIDIEVSTWMGNLLYEEDDEDKEEEEEEGEGLRGGWSR